MPRQRFIKSQDDNIYINATITNNTDKPISAEYQTTFNTAIINDSGEYFLTIVRFHIPNTMPIFKFVENKYVITLSYNGNDYSVPITMQNVDNPSSKSVYTFQQFVDMINTTLTASFNTLKAANPLAPPTEAPFMVFNTNTNFFSLYTQQVYDPVIAGGNTIEINFNSSLYSLFYNSFKVFNNGVNRTDNKDYRFIITDERNNIPVSPLNYYEMVQQVETLYQWYDFERLIITSSSLPIRSEFISTQGSDGKSIQQSIITDFIPELGKDRSAFVYNAPIYRLIDCNGHQDIRRFDFRILVANRDGSITALEIPPGFNVSVKFAFIRKQYEQNNFI